MYLRLTSVSGIFSGLLFVIGLSVLFMVNPQTYDELNNLSLASYNITGMNARSWAAVLLYGATGLLNVTFCVGLLSDPSQSSASLAGKILLMVCAVAWLSFGLIPYNPTIEISNHLLLIRLIVFIVASFTGLILLGTQYERVVQDRFLKWYTPLTAGLILLLSFLSAFIYDDETWVRTNASLSLYFLWLSAFGLRVLLK